MTSSSVWRESCCGNILLSILLFCFQLSPLQALKCDHGCSAAELEKEVSCLKQTLAAQKQASEEAQATALAQVLSLTEQLEQMSTASQTQDTALLSLKVHQPPPCYSTL